MKNFAPFAFLFVLLLSACTRSVRVPPADYDNPGSAAAYRVRTVDKQVYSVKHYTISDSAVVVTEFDRSDSSAGQDSLQAPFGIPLKNVESIDRVTMDRGKASGWVIGFGAAFLAILFFSGLSTLS